MSEFQELIERNYSETIAAKGQKLLEQDEGVTADEEASMVWWVLGSNRRKYRVQLVAGPSFTCTCPNGQAKGGEPTCYHTAAVAHLLLQREEAGLTEDGLDEWVEEDW